MQCDNWVLHSGLFVDRHLRQPATEECEARERATRAELKLKEQQYTEALWTLHELSNGAGHAAMNLYRAGQLQDRIDYGARNRTQARIWRAEAAMNRECAREMYCRY
jgi:hypothetical protein